MPLNPYPVEVDWLGRAMRSRGFLLSAWPWRATAHLVLTGVLLLGLAVPVALACAPLVATLDRPDPGSVPAGLAASVILLVGMLVLLAPGVARVQLARLRLVDSRPVPPIVEPDRFGPRWRHRLTSRAAWLRVIHLLVTLTLGASMVTVLLLAGATALGMLAAPALIGTGVGPLSLGPWDITTSGDAWLACALGLPATVAAMYLGACVAAADGLLARLLLVDPSTRADSQVREVSRSRARLVHGFDAERRRIERDLHDVAQQRVTTLTMQLALVEMDLAAELGAEHRLTGEVAAAHAHATELMTELRRLIHGIHPQVLTDVGVGAAIEQLAATMPLPIAVCDDLERRPAPHVESTLYFCLSEALTNAARHSGARQITVTLYCVGGTVMAEVRDDGHGGADPSQGTGLAGIADRAAVLEGTVTLTSPPGGPTVVSIALPDFPHIPAAAS